MEGAGSFGAGVLAGVAMGLKFLAAYTAPLLALVVGVELSHEPSFHVAFVLSRMEWSH